MKDHAHEKKLVKVGNYVMTGRILGKGHFARVQEAEHIHLKVKVAVKTLTFREVKDEYIIKNMRREAKILSRCSHPNVVYLFETILTTKRYYIITELVNGNDLAAYILSQPDGKLTENQTRPLAKQIVSGVAHLHSRGIVHRDLKMENILLDDAKEHVKLVDFGLSNYRRGIELFETHCGSPEYAAPELYISGKHYGPEIDIWSIGIVFYGMLVGKLPFQSFQKTKLSSDAKRKNLIRETKQGLSESHHKYLEDVSLLFRDLIDKMLCPNPEKRITMTNLQAHAWIYGRFIREYPPIDTAWKKTTLAHIAKITKMSFMDVCKAIELRSYASLAGIFNIAKLSEMQKRLEIETARVESREYKKELKNEKQEQGKDLQKLQLQHQRQDLRPHDLKPRDLKPRDLKPYDLNQLDLRKQEQNNKERKKHEQRKREQRKEEQKKQEQKQLYQKHLHITNDPYSAKYVPGLFYKAPTTKYPIIRNVKQLMPHIRTPVLPIPMMPVPRLLDIPQPKMSAKRPKQLPALVPYKDVGKESTTGRFAMGITAVFNKMLGKGKGSEKKISKFNTIPATIPPKSIASVTQYALAPPPPSIATSRRISAPTAKKIPGIPTHTAARAAARAEIALKAERPEIKMIKMWSQ